MKEQRFEKPETLLRQIANCDDVLTHWPDDRCSYLWLDKFATQCGSYRCIYGDFLYRRGGNDLLQRFVKAVSNSGAERHVHASMGRMDYLPANSDLGFPGWYAVFGDYSDGTLDERKAALQAHRNTLQALVDAWYQEREVVA